MKKTRKYAACGIMILIACTVAFIWRNSTLSRAASSGESDSVRGFLSSIFSYDHALGNFVLTYTRKIAHFVEFGILGFETSLYLGTTRRIRIKPFAFQLAFGAAVAAVDETIQIFTERGASVRDVLLDFSGYLTFTLFFWSVYVILLHLKRKGSTNA